MKRSQRASITNAGAGEVTEAHKPRLWYQDKFEHSPSMVMTGKTTNFARTDSVVITKIIGFLEEDASKLERAINQRIDFQS